MKLNWKLSSITNKQKRKFLLALTVKAFVTLTEAEGLHICDMQSNCVWFCR